MFTNDEIRIVSVEELRDAINKSLRNMLMRDGTIKVQLLQGTEIDLAIHLLRQFKAMRLTPLE